ncbi:1-acyl-sn-glycerol-3-phosphate acyltransferase [Acinetobacter johnsonii]|uniref:1-acyl-sn-glycerol-3-phosphate acyltransferase n=1 Tax=Acinetobacter TaxID=469 RepID=UPI0019A8E693|nr:MULTISPECIES: 1-acyl-sn-glycerol-3-phosphate acyltransferase [Acinetobacter]MBC6677508.1 1-acyl-sn-glycerol-3-phosphate acyltransferase [Acinetobacter sp.]MDH1363276.1 1-acyl-sn-glycerol-3-phosphate acyltransferase [Acinetobacter johnsonii]MDH1488896.1 1-acyl-sn-glycerol-3-phosphate acyltransferase [Acinetobacter johnsonii]MDH1614828.1 1-acyl-sn-glycerol-3-phosphate acyltransferase [Acinetobacter johnsonii]
MLQVEHDAKWIKRLSALSKLYFTPTFIGAEQLDASQPAMYVGNHSMYGVLDSPMLIDYLYNEHQVAVVSIADHSHFYLPLWRSVVKKFGAVDGVPDYVREAMQQGYSILVFPGGGREVLKREGEQYHLIWKQRYGFLKLAQEFGYDIVPFAALGGDEVFDIGFDANKVVQHQYFQKLLQVPQLSRLLRKGEVIPSLPKHLIPKRLPFYFKFMPRQSLMHIENLEQLQQFRDLIAAEIYTGLADLRVLRKQQHGDRFD